MRTTVDVDETLFAAAAQKLPVGTSKRVIFNEALRAFVSTGAATAVPVIGAFAHIPVTMHPDFDDPVPGFDP